jgi:hypothetical protein
MSRGIVVDHKESGVRYAISEKNFNGKVHTKVRALNPGETVLGFQPKRKPETPAKATHKTDGASSEVSTDTK